MAQLLIGIGISGFEKVGNLVIIFLNRAGLGIEFFEKAGDFG